MKKNIILALILITLWSCSKKNKDENFNLTVKINNLSNPKAKIYLTKSLIRINDNIIDSVSLKNGIFHIKGEMPEPSQIFLVIDKKGTGLKDLKNWSGILGMYLEKGNIHVSIKDSKNDYITREDAVITGSKLNTEFKAYNKIINSPTKYDDDYNHVNESIKEEVSDEKKKELKTRKKEISNKRRRYKDSLIFDFIKQKPNSYLSLKLLNDLEQRGFEEGALKPFFETFPPELRHSRLGLKFLENLNKKRLDIGAFAIDFTQNNEKGNPIKLSDFRGKYLLLDFWASWCAPCRAENPNLVTAYKKYHDKGFEILAVSLDKKREAWLKAIKQENLPWSHVSDLKGFENEVARLYNVHSIPKNLLIDPKGKIIAINLKGYILEEKLSQIFKK
ncbi:TlpA disulfide reductase family protein [Flavivirga jejuensis]|uniref:TlpA disulfide reductase family protein n=1 Tax=Flavivirga jejuensis TaxID=870487 RepID=A0ABT8WQR3_9FLAO|nr:TlpA disulfide reductase family protein [Flavivirga jejuensis]MDO5975513.1 TlpA disulfide reductase family protein [Flavivirga jejuensis]